MSQIDSMLLEIEDYSNNSNKIKSMVIERLRVDGILTDEQASTYSDKWQVIIIKPSWYRGWASLFCKSDSYRFKYVKFED